MKFLVCFGFIVSFFLVPKSEKRKFSDDKYTYEFSVIKNTTKLKLEKNVKVYWYALEKINTSFYGFNGKLLNGSFKKSLNDSNMLIEEGHFFYGLKNGEWKKWDVKGNLISVVSWKKGRKNGAFEYYNEDNKVKNTGTFKKGKKTGICTSVKNGTTVKAYWSNNLLNGVYKKYDSLGNLLIKGKYKRNLKSGIWIDYINNTKKRYDKDSIVEENVKSFWYFINKKKN